MSLTLFCVGGAFLVLALCLLRFAIIWLSKWLKRDPPPRDRVGVWMAISVVVGAGMGWGIHEFILPKIVCHQAGFSLFACIFLP